MTLGISNRPDASSAFAGSGLSSNGAMAAQNFLNAMLGQGDAPKSNGKAFLAEVKEAKDPEAKRALIHGYADGFMAASQGAEGGRHAGGTEGGAHGVRRAHGGRGPHGSSHEDRGPHGGRGPHEGRGPHGGGAHEGCGPHGSEGAQGAGGVQQGGAPGSRQDLMQGFREIADKIAASDLPEAAKNQLLDGIADLMSKLDANKGRGGEGCGGGDGAPGHADGPRGSCGPAPGGSAQADGGDGATRGAQAPKDGDRPAGANDGVWTHEVKGGEATVRLGDRYTVKANEKDATWTVTNNETGKTTRVSGDPHVDLDGDGKNDFDFKKDMTFKLDDGTKITVGTVPGGKDGATYSSQLTITNGDNAMQITGLGDKYDGANNLKVKQSMEGKVIDGLTSDGSNTISENGGAWQTRDGRGVDQAYIDQAEEMAG